MTKLTKKCIICEKEYIAHNWRSEVCSHKCHLARRRKWSTKNKDKINANARELYHNGGKDYYAKYEKTKKGFLMRKYRNMQSRVLGIQKLKAHLYLGKSLLDRQIFYDWALSSKEFHSLFKIWEEANYDRKLCPSVERINSSLGYTLSNMEWITHSENSRRGSLSKSRRKSR